MQNTHTRQMTAHTFVALILSLLMLLPFVFTAGAEDALPSLTLDTSKMSTISDGSNEYFSLPTQGGEIKNVTAGDHSDKVLRIAKKLYLITDIGGVLANYPTVTISADLYFHAFPSGTYTNSAGTEFSADPTSEKFYTQSVLSWMTKNESGSAKYSGIRIDSNGTLYNGTSLTDSLGITLKKQTWHNVKLVFTAIDKKMEIWVDGVRECVVATTPYDISHGVRLFDGSFSYDCYVKSVSIKTSNDVFFGGQQKESSADFISYQTTKPDATGKFDLRVITGLDSLIHQSFGYEVLAFSKDKAGNVTQVELEGADNKAYSSVYGGTTKYSIKENFGYQYAGLATVKGLDADFSRIELIVLPYTTDDNDNRIYGDAVSLVYAGEKKNGYPVFVEQSTAPTNIYSTDDTMIYVGYPTTNYGANQTAQIRNPGNESSTLYRAAYFKFTVPAETVAKLENASRANFILYIASVGSDATRVLRPLELYAANTAWNETTLTANNRNTLAARGQKLGVIENYDKGNYISYDILEHLRSQTKNADGSITVSFCIRQPDGYNDTREVSFYTKETGDRYIPTLRIESSYYGRELANQKRLNNGEDPIGYAKKLADTWFDELIDKIYPKDKDGNLIYHEIEELAPNGYNAATPTGDFTNETTWKGGTVWTTNATNGYMVTDENWENEKFMRTVSTLGTSTANKFLSSDYAKNTSIYDSFGGIINAGFTGTATGFFHTEKHGDRTYIIDPLGNPYFALGVNTVTIGDTENHKTYSLAKYETSANYYNKISASLKTMGLNTFYGGDYNQLLAVDNGLAGVVGINVVTAYMRDLGRSQVSEGKFPFHNTINVFDPDFETSTKKYLASTIAAGGYADMPNLFGYSTDNELPSDTDILERYLLLDPTVLDSAFSYHAAWEWLVRRLDKANPTLSDVLTHKDRAALNSEFLGYVYGTYYRVARDAIKAADPNHMYLGSRVNSICRTDESYLRVAGYYLDIITANLYGGLNPDAQTITNFYRYSGKPFIVTEFFAKATDSLDANGLRLANSTGAGILVNEQQDRADYYEHYALILLESKACVGWTWYRYRDNDQSLWSAGGIDNLRMLHVTYGENAGPNTLMDTEGNIYTTSELGSWPNDFVKTYSGEALASNQNVNKGIYNSNFSSTVVVYTYDKNGKLIYSEPHEVMDPASANATTLKSKDGKTTFTVGTKTLADGSTQKTVLTTYEGKYVALAGAIKNISDNLIGLVNYFDAN